MSKFNLYYTLNINLRKKDLTKSEKTCLLTIIDQFDQQEREMFFMIVHEHHVVNGGKERTIPYEGVQMDNGVEYNLTKLPIPLRHILFKFGKMVEKRKKSDEEDLCYRRIDTTG